MRKTVIIRALAVVVALILLGSMTSFAGVVIDEQEVIDQGNGHPETQQRTLMIQGNKQKMTTDHLQVITDLDKGVGYVLNPAEKSYIQMPFPPQGPMAKPGPGLTFKKTGAHKTVVGYSCDEYASKGNSMGREYSVKGCFSSKAPGATDFNAFQKTMADKVKGTPMAISGDLPEGVPLQIDSVIKMTGANMPGMTADQAKQMRQALANRPPIIQKTTVTKIAASDLPADTFTVPAGFARQELPPAPGPGQPPPSAKSPE